MPTKRTFEEVREYIKSQGYTLLSDVYIGNKAKLDIACPLGHLYQANFHNFHSGYRCPDCGGSKRLTVGYVRSQMEKEGYKLLSTEYKNAHQKLDVECNRQHQHSRTWNDFKNGSRCPVCAVEKRRLSLAEDFETVKAEIESAGYALLSREYKNSLTPLKMRCDKGHEFEQKFKVFRNGHRCPACAIEKRMGSGNCNWNHEMSDEERFQQRQNKPYLTWRDEVYKRDRYTCQKCSVRARGGNIAAHHILPYKTSPAERYNVSNGITFCRPCHILFHQTYGWKDNNREQILQFLNSSEATYSLP